MAHYINKMQGKYLPVYTVVGMMVHRSCQVSYNINEQSPHCLAGDLTKSNKINTRWLEKKSKLAPM